MNEYFDPEDLISDDYMEDDEGSLCKSKYKFMASIILDSMYGTGVLCSFLSLFSLRGKKDSPYYWISLVVNASSFSYLLSGPVLYEILYKWSDTTVTDSFIKGVKYLQAVAIHISSVTTIFLTLRTFSGTRSALARNLTLILIASLILSSPQIFIYDAEKEICFQDLYTCTVPVQEICEEFNYKFIFILIIFLTPEVVLLIFLACKIFFQDESGRAATHIGGTLSRVHQYLQERKTKDIQLEAIILVYHLCFFASYYSASIAAFTLVFSKSGYEFVQMAFTAFACLNVLMNPLLLIVYETDFSNFSKETAPRDSGKSGKKRKTAKNCPLICGILSGSVAKLFREECSKSRVSPKSNPECV